MLDKKEIGELTYKVSVDTSDLNKLEEQLTRIKQLMQDVGIKVSIKSEQSNDFFIAGSGNYFIKDAVIKDAVISSADFKVMPVINKLEQAINAHLANLHMRADRQDASINELIKARVEDQQVWSQAVRELNNRTWCSQK